MKATKLTARSTNGGAARDWRTFTAVLTVWTLLATFFLTPDAPLIVKTQAAGSYSGIAFRDFDMDGTIDTLDAGLSGVTVTMFGATGSCTTTTAATTGTWAINTATCNSGGALTAAANPNAYRVEFTWAAQPSYLQNTIAAAGAANSGSSVRFVADNGATGINIGYSNPRDYVSAADPTLVLPNYMYAGADPGRTTASLADNGLLAFPYSSTGTTAPTLNATAAQLGTTWGTAHHRPSGNLFAAAVLKRNHDLGSLVRPATGGADAAINVDGIYRISYANAGTTGSYLGGFLLNGVTPSGSVTGNAGQVLTGAVTRRIQTAVVAAGGNANALSVNNAQTNLLTDTANIPTNANSYDVDAFAKVGKVGFGAASMQENELALWTVNLNQKSLVRVDTSNVAALPTGGAVSGASVQNWTIPNTLTVGTACATAAQMRPWAVKLKDGFGYVGVVCDASLVAKVLRFNPTNVAGGFTEVVSMPLNYTREAANSNTVNDNPPLVNPCTSQRNWNNWFDTIASIGNNLRGGCPQPILSNIEFTENGDMVLGFIDRTTMQFDFNNYGINNTSGNFIRINSSGDIVHVCNNSGTYVVEGAAGCVIDNDNTAADATEFTNDGANGAGEFYFADRVAPHGEIALGGLAVRLGSGEVVANIYDPLGAADNSHGARWFQSRNGTATSQGSQTKAYQPVAGTVSKGTGIGDLELLSNAAPIEIGNRIWNDGSSANANGRQDPGELGYSGIVVQLWVDTDDNVNTPLVQVTSTTTDANGNYLFSSAAAGTAGGAVYGVSALLPGRAFQVRILRSNYPSGTVLTASDSTNGTDMNDNDASGQVLGGTPYAVASGVLGATPGANNHTYDFGFMASATAAELNLGGTVTNGSGAGIAFATVQLMETATGTVRTTQTNKRGQYSFVGIDINSFVFVTVNKAGYRFEPSQRSLSLTQTSDSVNFTGTPQKSDSFSTK